MKKKVIVIPMIVILAIILIGGTVFASLYFFTDIFKSNKDLFFNYISQNVELLEALNSEALNKYVEKQKNTAYSFEGNIKTNVTFDDKTKTNLANALQNCSITFLGTKDPVNKYSHNSINLNYSDSQSFNIELLNNNDIYAIGSKDVTGDRFIGFQNDNLKEFARKMGATEDIIEKIPNKIDIMQISQMQLQNDINTDQELEKIINNYAKIIEENLKDDMFSKEQSEQGNVYCLTFNENNLKTIGLKLLETVKNDQLLLDKFKQALIKSANIPEVDANNAISEFQNSIQKILDSATMLNESQSVQETDSFAIKIKVYENNKKLVKTELLFEVENNQNSSNLYGNEISILLPKIVIEKQENGISFIYDLNGSQKKLNIVKKESQGYVSYIISLFDGTETLFELSMNYEGIDTEEPKEIAEVVLNINGSGLDGYNSYYSLDDEDYYGDYDYSYNNGGSFLDSYAESFSSQSYNTKIVSTVTNQKKFGNVIAEPINNNILLLNTAPNFEKIQLLMEEVANKTVQVNSQKFIASGMNIFESPIVYYLSSLIPIGGMYVMNSGDFAIPMFLGVLSGSSIAYMSGDNGILSKAEEAKANTEIANERETIQLAIYGAKTDMYKESYSNGTALDVTLTKEKIEKYLDNSEFYIIENLDDTFTIKSLKTGNEYKYDKKGIYIDESETNNNYYSNSDINTNSQNLVLDTKSTIEDVDLSKTEKTIFNSLFKGYEGMNKSYSNVNSLIFTIKNSNSNNSEHIVSINGQNANLFQNVDDSKLYNIKFNYDENGYISNAIIE